MILSIVIPVYNVQGYLDECLNSILNQECVNENLLEIVLIDDGSTDDSGIICDNYQKRYENLIRVIHKKNEGLLLTRRRGFWEARGEYVWCCDSDDMLEKGSIRSAISVLERFKPDITIFNAYLLKNGKKTVFFSNIFEQGYVRDKSNIFDRLLLTCSINSMWCKIVKRTIVDIDTDYSRLRSCSYGEDFLQSIPLFIKASSVFYFNKCLYDYRINSGMMRKSNPLFYGSYRKVNIEAERLLRQMNIPELFSKLGVHLLKAAFGSIAQLRYDMEYSNDRIEAIGKDKRFRKLYRKVHQTKYDKMLTIKERIVIWLLYEQHFDVLRIIIWIRKNMI